MATDSPYIFAAGAQPLSELAPGVMGKEAAMADGLILRYQERAPGPPGDWCITGHSVFVVSGRLKYQFDDHSAELGPGDMAHIPAGPDHRHQPQAVGDEPVRYYLTEFE